VSPNRTGVAGCQHSGNQTATLDSRPTAIGSNWYLDLRNAPANSAAFCLIAPGATMPGPFSLQPFIPGIQASCQGQISLASVAVLSALTNSSGGYTWTTAIPNNRLLYNDFVVTSQVASLDFFSPAGVVVSNADEIQFGIDPACTIVSSQGSASATSGSIYANYGVVTLFEYN
jgi:hypothetical protein